MHKPQVSILPSVSGEERLPNHTKPYNDASADTLVSLFGSYMVSTGREDSAFFSVLNTVAWSMSQTQQFFFERRSWSSLSLSLSDSWGMLITLRKLLNSPTYVGSIISVMAFVFLGSGRMPAAVMLCHATPGPAPTPVGHSCGRPHGLAPL